MKWHQPIISESKAITIDEGIPGYRDEALEIVEKFCEKLNVEHKVYSYKDLFELTLGGSIRVERKQKNFFMFNLWYT